MTAWRWAVAVLLGSLFGVPLLMPFVELVQYLPIRGFADDFHFLAVTRNTLVLAAGTLLLAIPVGTLAAILLFRTALPGRPVLRGFIVAALFVPLPLIIAAWLTTFGREGWFPFKLHEPTGQGPWWDGLAPAVAVNTLAVLPAVILLVGQGLRWVEAELEEDALLVAGPVSVLWHVTLPRCRAILGAAALWVFLFTLSEIAVADAFKVVTFAETINVQFDLGRDALARALILSLPAMLATLLLVYASVPRLDRALPPLPNLVRWPRDFGLGRARWTCLAVVIVLVFSITIIPFGSLVWKLGVEGSPPSWSGATAVSRFAAEFRLFGGHVGAGLAWSVLAALLTTTLGLLASWAALESPLFRAGLLLLVALTWALPGPVLSLGLKATINLILDVCPGGWLEDILYRAQSPIPGIWAQMLRFFPVATALTWPMVRMIPRELFESARMEGAKPRHELMHIVLPLAARSLCWTAFVVTALALGEFAAGRRVETPGSESFASLLFNRLHTGATPDVAALCLVLAAWLLAALAAAWLGAMLWKRATKW
jgi:iron(III) transport system permease protein